MHFCKSYYRSHKKLLVRKRKFPHLYTWRKNLIFRKPWLQERIKNTGLLLWSKWPFLKVLTQKTFLTKKACVIWDELTQNKTYIAIKSFSVYLNSLNIVCRSLDSSSIAGFNWPQTPFLVCNFTFVSLLLIIHFFFILNRLFSLPALKAFLRY